MALWTTLFTFIVSLTIWMELRSGRKRASSSSMKLPWLGSIKYKMGVDGISMLFVILTTFLMPLCILASWESDPDARQRIHDRLFVA